MRERYTLGKYEDLVDRALAETAKKSDPKTQPFGKATLKIARSFVDENISLHCDASLAQRLLIHRKPGHERGSLGRALKSLLQLVRPGNYAALLAYVEPSTANQEALTGLRR